MAKSKKITTRKKTTSKQKTDKGILVEAAENIEEGAKIVGEKTSVIAADAYEKVKKGAADVFDASSKVVTDLYKSASEYAELFKDKIEMQKLKSERDRLSRDLGKYFYLRYRVEGLSFRELSAEKDFKTLIKDIEKVDKEAIRLGKSLSKTKK
ncbi:hypothetical protein MUO66_01820 [Candidatus Bathyarchaeota archaeon]|nr:hypothetical protein [Candidatus Bathyarchaeota archaeon]